MLGGNVQSWNGHLKDYGICSINLGFKTQEKE